MIFFDIEQFQYMEEEKSYIFKRFTKKLMIQKFLNEQSIAKDKE